MEGKKRKTEESLDKGDGSFDCTAKLFVGGVNAAVGKEKLKEVFDNFGRVKDVSTFPDKGSFTNQDKILILQMEIFLECLEICAGFAFVSYHDRREASKAKAAIDGTTIQGRSVSNIFSFKIVTFIM